MYLFLFYSKLSLYIYSSFLVLDVVSCFLVYAYRGAWRGWLELSTARAAVTCAPAAGWQSAAVDKALLFMLTAARWYLLDVVHGSSLTVALHDFKLYCFCALGKLNTLMLSVVITSPPASCVSCSSHPAIQPSAPLQPGDSLRALQHLDAPHYHQLHYELSHLHLQLHTTRWGPCLERSTPSLSEPLWNQ